MKIKAKLTLIRRARVQAPDDGAHQRGRGGILGTTKSCECGEKLVPCGKTAFYWQTSKKQGVKVFVGLEKNVVPTARHIRKIYKKMKNLSKTKYSPKVYKYTRTQVDIEYNGKRIKKSAPSIVMEHVDYADKPFRKYVQGYPYDWNALSQKSHPEHTPEGLKRFRKKLRKAYKQAGYAPRTDRVIIGNCLYSVKKKRWQIVDVI